MREAIKDLRLERLDVIHAGEVTFPLADKIRAVALAQITKDLKPKKRAIARKR